MVYWPTYSILSYYCSSPNLSIKLYLMYLLGKKHSIYNLWYYQQFQASTGGWNISPADKRGLSEFAYNNQYIIISYYLLYP